MHCNAIQSNAMQCNRAYNIIYTYVCSCVCAYSLAKYFIDLLIFVFLFLILCVTVVILVMYVFLGFYKFSAFLFMEFLKCPSIIKDFIIVIRPIITIILKKP